MTTPSVQQIRSIPFLLAFAVLSAGLAAESTRQTVDEVAHSSFRVTTPAGSGLLPIYVSSDLSKPQPRVTRALVIFHGKKRNAGSYFRSADAVTGHSLPDDLHRSVARTCPGAPPKGPAPVKA